MKIRDVQKRITIDPFDVLFVVTNGGSNEKDAFTPVFLLDAAKIFLGGTAVITVRCGLSIGYQDEDSNLFPTATQVFSDKSQRSAVAVVGASRDIHKPVLVIMVDGIKLRI